MRIVLAVLLLLTTPALAAAQSSSANPSSIVRGRVTAATDNAPLRRARLIVIADGRTGPSVYADDAGAFELPVPSSGSYRITATKAGYAPFAIAGPRDTSRPIVVSMIRGAVIRGKVTDMAGDAVVSTIVSLRAATGSQAAPITDVTVETDDRGEFRFGNLPAGRYELKTYRGIAGTAAFGNMPPEIARRMSLEMQEARRRLGALGSAEAEASAGEEASVTIVQSEPSVSLPYARVGGVITGTLTDEFGEPLEGAIVQLWLTRFVDGRQSIFPGGVQRGIDDSGRFRLFHIPAGRYILTASPALEPAAIADPSLPAYLPVYFPGRFEVSGASVIQVDPASETPGIDMVVARSFGARVFGVALSAAGTPLEGEVRLVPSQTTGPVQLAPTFMRNGLTANALVAYPDREGRFEMTGVAPGLYAVQAAATLRSKEMIVLTDTIAGVRQPPPMTMMHNEGISEFTVQRHTVTEGDFGPLTLTTLPTTTIRGAVTVEGPRQRITPAEFLFTVAHVDPDEVPAMVGIRPDITLLPTGEFEATGLSGRARIILTRGPTGWWLKSVNIGGTNAADVPVNFDLPASSRDDVTLVLAATGATISGRVTNIGDAPGASVVIFPVDRDKRLSGSRYVRTTAVGSEGEFSLNSFPPGQYYVVGVEEAEGDSTGDWENPDLLDAIASVAQRLTLTENGTYTVELPMRAAPR